jgi:hypothetical protein
MLAVAFHRTPDLALRLIISAEQELHRVFYKLFFPRIRQAFDIKAFNAMKAAQLIEELVHRHRHRSIRFGTKETTAAGSWATRSRAANSAIRWR